MNPAVSSSDRAQLTAQILGSWGHRTLTAAGVDVDALVDDVIADYGHADPDRMHGPRVLSIVRAHVAAAMPATGGDPS